MWVRDVPDDTTDVWIEIFSLEAERNGRYGSAMGAMGALDSLRNHTQECPILFRMICEENEARGA